MTPVRPQSPAPPGRIPALDAAKALAVAAMVVGHTLDALLDVPSREEPLVATYWKLRGLTAPIFLVTAGWSIGVAILRGGARGAAVPVGRLPRVALLLVLAFALRWPGWGTDLLRAGDQAVWAHLLAFDALHCIALSLLVTAVVLGLPLSVREKGGVLLLLTVLSLALGMGGTAPLVPDPSSLPRSIFGLAMAQAMGGTSPFALAPWSAYFFVGAIVALLTGRFAGRAALAVGAAGALAALAAGPEAIALPAGHPVLFALRAGIVLVLLAFLSAAPARIASLVSPLGRSSLGVYAIHLAVVYGWSTHQGLIQRIGPTLGPAPALGVAALLLAGSLALGFALGGALRAGHRLVAWAWERRAVAAGLVATLLRATRAARG